VNKRRRLLIAVGVSALAAPFVSIAQQPVKVWRIGFLGQVSASALAATRVDPLRQGLREFGYIEGKNLVIEVRGANKYEQLPALAEELVRLKIDVLVVQGTPAALAAKRATTTIPIVMPSVADPVATGLVASLARPGGNITGFTYLTSEITAKRLEILKEVLPRIKRIAVLVNPNNTSTKNSVQAIEVAARSLKLELQQFDVRSVEDVEGAFSLMTEKHIEAIVVVDDAVLNINVKKIAELAAKKRLPSIGITELVLAGGLISYGMDLPEMYRRSAFFIDKILKGAKPGDIPIERPTIFELIVNQKTAKALGIKFPQTIMVQATKVIE